MASLIRLRALSNKIGGLENQIRYFCSNSAITKTVIGRTFLWSDAYFVVQNGLRPSALTRYHATSAASVARTDEKTDNSVSRGRVGSRVRNGSGSLEDQLSSLDHQVRRWGRVDKEQLQALLQLVKERGSVTPQQSIMLLRCTGSLLVKESASERAAIFDETVKLLESIGAEVNIQVYNAMLRVKLENGQTFSPADVLSELETRLQLVPNRVTYQMLIGQFCAVGDIEGASKILEHMKKQTIPINENIFHFLLKGYVKNGNVAGAKEVLTAMSAGGLEPTAETYKVAACAFAESGDLNSLSEMLTEAGKNDCVLSPRQTFEIITSLALNDQKDYVHKMLNSVKRDMTAPYSHDALNAVFQMVANGKDALALDTLLTIDRSRYDLDQSQWLGRVLIRALIIKKRPVETVLNIGKKLNEEKLEPSLGETIAILSSAHQTAEYALEMLDKLQSENFEIKTHYFQPLLSAYAKRGDLNGVSEVAKRVVKQATGFELIEALYVHSIRELLRRGEKIENILPALKSAGVSEANLAEIECMGLISSGKLQQALDLAKSQKLSISASAVKSELARGFRASNDIPGFINVLKSLDVGSSADVNTFVTIGILKSQNVQKELAENLITALIENDLKLFTSYEGVINQALTKLDVNNELIQKMDDLYVDTRRGVSLEKLKEASIKELESWVEKAAQTQSGQKKTFEKWLLVKYCEKGEVDKAMKLKASLQNEGFIFQEFVLLRLGILAARNKGDLAEAQDCIQQISVSEYRWWEAMAQNFSLSLIACISSTSLISRQLLKLVIESKYPAFSQYTALVLHVANLQLKNNLHNDAIATLKNYHSRHGEFLQNQLSINGFTHANLCGRLVQSSVEHVKDSKLTQELMSTLFDLKFVTSGTYSVLEQFVKSAISRSRIRVRGTTQPAMREFHREALNDHTNWYTGDGDEILSTLQFCVSKYEKAPLNDDILRFFIAKDDLQRLQTAVDLVTLVYGEKNVLLHLVYCFIECGKLTQARKILETPGLRASMAPLLVGCNRFIEQNKVKELEQLIELTKRVQNVDREEMLFQLIKIHAKNKDTTKMMEAFTMFEEEAIQPKPRTLRYVANVLQSHNLTVPFQVPQANQAQVPETRSKKADTTKAVATDSAESTAVPKTIAGAAAAMAATSGKTSRKPAAASSEKLEEILKALKEHDLDKAMQIKESVGNKKESLQLMKEVMKGLSTKQHTITLRRLMFALAEKGDIESLEAMEEVNEKNNFKIYLCRNLLRAHLNSNRADEILSRIKSDLTILPKYVTAGLLGEAAEKYADKFSVLESLIFDYGKTNKTPNNKPVGDLYSFYLLNRQYDKASELVKITPNVKDEISLKFLCEQSRKTQKEDVLLHLLKTYGEEKKSNRLVIPYNELIGLKCDQKDWKQALDYCNQASSDGIGFESLYVKNLKELQTLLEENNQPIPWTAEDLKKAEETKAQKIQQKIGQRKSRARKGATADKSSSSSDSSSSDSDNEKKS